MTEQLKPLPCPFCGRTDIRAHVYGGGEPDAFMQCHDCSADGPNGLNRAGAIEAWNRRAQPAQAVPSDVVRDAARYRFLAAHCRSTPEHWGGRWSIVIEGPCPERQDCEDAFDAAIDAAAAQGEKP